MIVIAPAVVLQLSQQNQTIVYATLFPDLSNSVAIALGTVNLKAGVISSSFENSIAQLDPGRMLKIYVDDYETEVFDLSRLFVTHSDPAQNQLLHLTVFTPNDI